MANDINSVVLVGRLTRDLGSDPNGKDFSYTQSGMCIGRISIAVNKQQKQSDGTYQSVGDFYDVTLFGKLAENLKPYLTKGKQIIVQGHLNQDKWVDQQTGQNRSKIGIIADNVQLVGGQSQNNQQSNGYKSVPVQQYQAPQNYPQQGGYQQQNYPQQNGYQSQPQSVAQPMIQQPQQSFAGEGFPEDIPF